MTDALICFQTITLPEIISGLKGKVFFLYVKHYGYTLFDEMLDVHISELLI